MKRGIDVSRHNGAIDWAKVKAAGIEFAMIRAGYGTSVDSRFRYNASECNRLGIDVGIYWFSYAINTTQARQEAELCITTISQYTITYPVSYDFEYDSIDNARKKGVTITSTLMNAMATAFLTRIEQAGYYAINYTNIDFLNRGFAELTDRFDTWLAQWSVSAPTKPCGIWQYSATGRVNGIAGDVDLNYAIKDYTNPVTPPSPSPVTETASPYVIASIAGCFDIESKLNPGMWHNLIVPPGDNPWYYVYDITTGTGGYGLAQLINSRNETTGTINWVLKNEYEWLTDIGTPISDGGGQLTFMIYENYWAGHDTVGPYDSLYEFLNTDYTVIDVLVYDFLDNWLLAPDDRYFERVARANYFLQYITDHANDNPNNYRWISKNEVLTESETLNNLMCMYFYFTNGSPSPPYPPKKKGMPLWMMVRYIKF